MGYLRSACLFVAYFVGPVCVGIAGDDLSDGPVALDCDEGLRLFRESDERESFVALSLHFTTQDNLGYCGPASCAMVLNASGIDRPVSGAHAPFKLFTQENLFTQAVRKVATPETVRKSGMTLKTLGEVLKTYPLAVEVTHAKDITLNEFRKTARKVLMGKGVYFLVNYHRRTVAQEGGGHISPLAAYHEKSDRFLILDVARFKYPPVWVKGWLSSDWPIASDSVANMNGCIHLHGKGSMAPLNEHGPCPYGAFGENTEGKDTSHDSFSSYSPDDRSARALFLVPL